MKFYDTPETVRNNAYAATKLGVSMFTVHIHGGSKMLEYAKQGINKAAIELEEEKPKIIGVTVLTSFNNSSYQEVLPSLKANNSQELNNVIEEQVLRLAGIAERAGIEGIVCSPKEVKQIKELYKGLLTVVPGIEHPKSGVSGSTQNVERIATPSTAIKNGADYLVIGSAITKAANPRQALIEVLEDIEQIKT